MERPTALSELGARYPELLAEVSRTGRNLDRQELESLPGVARAGSVGRLRRTGEALLAAAEAAVAALGEGHERAQQLAIRQKEAARREFIDDLLYGRSDPGRWPSGSSGSGCGWPARTRWRSRSARNRTTERTRWRAGWSANSSAASANGTSCWRPRTVGWCASPPAARTRCWRRSPPSRSAPAPGTGRRHSGAGGVVCSYDEAPGALDCAQRLDLPAERLRAEEVLVFPVLIRDRAAMAELVRSVLDPRGGWVWASARWATGWTGSSP